LFLQTESWNNDCEQISTLLQSLKQIMELLNSVTRVSQYHKLESVHNTFPDLFETMEGQLVVDIEDTLIQIKKFM
jgi:hypothetical protein